MSPAETRRFTYAFTRERGIASQIYSPQRHSFSISLFICVESQVAKRPSLHPSLDSQRACKIHKTKLQNKTRKKLLCIGNDFSSVERVSRLVVFQAHRQHFVCRIAACPWSSVVSSGTYLSLYSSPLVCFAIQVKVAARQRSKFRASICCRVSRTLRAQRFEQLDNLECGQSALHR